MGVSSLDLDRRRKPRGPFFVSAMRAAAPQFVRCALTIIIASREGEDDEIGRLVHKPGGAEHARWVFDYNPDEDDDDEARYRFGVHAFVPGEYVSISGQDGKLH